MKGLQQSTGSVVSDTAHRTAMHLGQRPNAVQNPPPPPPPPQRRSRLRRRCHRRHRAAVVGGQQRRITPAALGGPHTTKDTERARAEGAVRVSCRARGVDVDHDDDDCRGWSLVQFASQIRQAPPKAPAVVKGAGSPTTKAASRTPPGATPQRMSFPGLVRSARPPQRPLAALSSVYAAPDGRALYPTTPARCRAPRAARLNAPAAASLVTHKGRRRPKSTTTDGGRLAAPAGRRRRQSQSTGETKTQRFAFDEPIRAFKKSKPNMYQVQGPFLERAGKIPADLVRCALQTHSSSDAARAPARRALPLATSRFTSRTLLGTTSRTTGRPPVHRQGLAS